MTEDTKKARPKKPSAYEQPTAEKKAFGVRMRTAREVAGISLTEAAVAMGYSQPVQLSNMENGNRQATLRVLMLATTLYGTTMDYLCGFTEDTDRDPANAALRHVTNRVTADVQRLIGEMTRASVSVVRELMPTSAEGQRLASLVIEANMAMAVFQQRNPKFQDMRAGETLVRKLHMATEAATLYAATTARARRKAQALQCTTTDGPTDLPDQAQDSFNPLPALDLLALPQHLAERTATCHAEAD